MRRCVPGSPVEDEANSIILFKLDVDRYAAETARESGYGFARWLAVHGHRGGPLGHMPLIENGHMPPKGECLRRVMCDVQCGCPGLAK